MQGLEVQRRHVKPPHSASVSRGVVREEGCDDAVGRAAHASLAASQRRQGHAPTGVLQAWAPRRSLVLGRRGVAIVFSKCERTKKEGRKREGVTY